MKVSQGNTYWNENVQILANYPYVSEDKECDVLIVGGGIGGALTAYYQAKEGSRVIVVDKNIIGFGDTLVNNGIMEIMIDFANNKQSKILNQKSIDKCNNLCKDALQEIQNIIQAMLKDEDCLKHIADLGLSITDTIYYSDRVTSKIYMYKQFEKLAKNRTDVEYIEEDQLLNLKTAIVIPDSSGVINPYIFTELIYLMLSKMKNVEIYENSRIDEILSKDEGVECITNNRFKIYSRNVILAEGIQGCMNLKNTDVTVNRTFTIVTEPIKTLNKQDIQIVANDINMGGHTIRFTDDKRIILSGEDTKENERMLNSNYFKQLAQGKYKKLYLALHRLLDIPEDTKLTNCFSGTYLDTKDSLPIIDELDNFPNVYCNLGVGKNGIIFSTIGAKMLKNISKQYHEKDMYLFRENRW